MVVVGSGSTTSCGRCVGGSLLSVINKHCNVTGVLFSLLYKLVDIVVECGVVYKGR